MPNVIQNVTLQAGPDAGQLVGLQLLIPRIWGSAAGHMAHSGYLGYFIGLSALKPRKRTHFGRRLFQRFGTSRFVECVGSSQRTFRGLGGSFVLFVFGSGDLTELFLRIERKILQLAYLLKSDC